MWINSNAPGDEAGGGEDIGRFGLRTLGIYFLPMMQQEGSHTLAHVSYFFTEPVNPLFRLSGFQTL